MADEEKSCEVGDGIDSDVTGTKKPLIGLSVKSWKRSRSTEPITVVHFSSSLLGPIFFPAAKIHKISLPGDLRRYSLYGSSKTAAVAELTRSPP